MKSTKVLKASLSDQVDTGGCYTATECRIECPVDVEDPDLSKRRLLSMYLEKRAQPLQ